MKIYKQILQELKPVQFREVAQLKEDEKSLKERHYSIIVIQTLIKVAQSLGNDFKAKNGSIYLFNGMYWEKIDAGVLAPFLREVAIRVGLDKYLAEHHMFIQNLIKQFYVSTSSIESEDNTAININLLNGTFEFGSVRVFREFRKDDFLTYQLPFNYDDSSQATLFTEYMNKVLPDMQCQQILAEYIGYIFTQGIKLEKCLLLYGSGANGKSVFFDIITALLGKQNMSNCTLRELGNPNARALIANKLLNYSSELDAGINSDTFKQLVTGEPIQVKSLYKDVYTIDNYAKLMFNCNELPKDVEYNNAYFRRWLIIPFTQTIPEQEQDKELASKIIANELSGVFNWVLAGLQRLLEQGNFSASEAVEQAVNQFKQESDSVHQFVVENGYVKSVRSVKALSILYREFTKFCLDNGFRVCNVSTFRKRLEFHGFKTGRRNYGTGVEIEMSIPERPDREEFDDDEEDDELPF